MPQLEAAVLGAGGVANVSFVINSTLMSILYKLISSESINVSKGPTFAFDDAHSILCKLEN